MNYDSYLLHKEKQLRKKNKKNESKNDTQQNHNLKMFSSEITIPKMTQMNKK